MTQNFHHGPEVIEHKDGVTVVRDVRSAVTYINGTAPIGELYDNAEDRAELINKRIIVRSRQDAAKFGPQMAGYNIPNELDAIFDQGFGGTIIVNNVFDPEKHSSPADVTLPELTGGVDEQGQRTGMHGAFECYARFGYFPKIYLSDRSDNPAMRVEMDQIAHRLNGHAICDLPLGLTKQQAVEARGTQGIHNANTSSARTILTYPHVKVLDTETGDERFDKLSSRLAGVMIQTDLTQGYHHSPSNREIKGVIGSEVDIDFYATDYQNDTNFLNEAGIVTCMRSFATGFRMFGNRSAAFPTSSHHENFIHSRRIQDQLHEAIVFFSMQYIDRIGTPQNIEALEEGVNAFLRRKVGEGVLYGGRFFFDRSKNTPEQIADGRFYYTLEYHPISVMERITIDSYVDTKFISDALALAA